MKTFICVVAVFIASFGCKRGKKTESIWDALGPLYIQGDVLHQLLELKYFLSEVDRQSKSMVFRGQNFDRVNWFISSEDNLTTEKFTKVSRQGSVWRVFNEEIILFEKEAKSSSSKALLNTESTSNSFCLESKKMKSMFQPFCESFKSVEALEFGQKVYVPKNSKHYAEIMKSGSLKKSKIEIWPIPTFLYVKHEYLHRFQDQILEKMEQLESASNLYRESQLINLN